MLTLIFVAACIAVILGAQAQNRSRKSITVDVQFASEVRRIAELIKKNDTSEGCKDIDVTIDRLHAKYRHSMDEDFYKNSILHLTALNDKKHRALYRWYNPVNATITK